MDIKKRPRFAVPKRMAKKGGQASLQVEVQNEYDWKALLEKPGLIDVYSEWCGPCTGMVGILKKIKLEIGSDYLILATAKADGIAQLERFKNRSEPTWLFIGGGKLLKVFYGSNAPLLMRLIQSELDKEVKAIKGESQRKCVEWGELTVEEIHKKEEITKQTELELAKEKEEEDQQLDKIKRRNLERYARRLLTQTLIIFFPQIINEVDEHHKKRTCAAAYKLMTMYDTVGLMIVDQLDVMLNKNDIYDLFYNTEMIKTFPQEFLEMLTTKQCMVTLLQEVPEEVTSIENIEEPRASRVTRFQSKVIMPSEINLLVKLLDKVEEKLANLVYGHLDPLNPRFNTIAKSFLTDLENGNIIPGMWTPIEHISKTAAMKVLFPRIIQSLELTEDVAPPPSYVMIFDAYKAKEVLQAAESFVDDIRHIGYFDSTDPNIAKRIAKTLYDLVRQGGSKVRESKMVIALRKTKSEPMLILSQQGPIYISPDLKVGTKEVDMFFPPTIEIEIEPDHWYNIPSDLEPTDQVYVDEQGNEYMEEIVTDEETGQTKIIKKIISYANGKLIEEEEKKEEKIEQPSNIDETSELENDTEEVPSN